MKVVVSDTSPIRALGNLGLLALIERIFTEVFVPPAVARELGSPPDGQIVVDVGRLACVQIQVPSDESLVDRFLDQLDRGESEALALALGLGADLILLDEAAGRSIARQLGLPSTGVLGILLEAKRIGAIDLIAPTMDRLREEFRFYLSDRVRVEVLRLAGELP